LAIILRSEGEAQMVGFPNNKHTKHRMNARIRQWAQRSDTGQVIVIIALVFIGLVAFTGLVVDGGTLLIRYAQLRRAVDAAAVQAANQFREFRDLYNPSNGEGDMFRSAAQVFASQGGDTGKLRLFACMRKELGTIANDASYTNSSPPIGHDPTDDELIPQLCSVGDEPQRKLVRVDAWLEVGLPFLSVVGWRSIPLEATSTAEAAAVDLVIVLDRSASMARETPGDPISDHCANNPDPANRCFPFEDVRRNAATLAGGLKYPYDSVALVTFDRYARVYNPATGAFEFFADMDVINTHVFMTQSTTVLNALNDNTKFNIELDSECPGISSELGPTNMEGYCMDTNVGGGLRAATTIMAVQARRRGSVWMMLLLTDGAPNVTDSLLGSFTAGFCPPQTWPPQAYADLVPGGAYTVPGYSGVHVGVPPYGNSLCLRINYASGADLSFSQIKRACLISGTAADAATQCENHPGWNIADVNGLDYKYDAVDYARDMADYMSSNGIVAFVIGLGPQVSDASNRSLFDGAAPRDPHAGERLLRYVADVGTQPNTWQCHSDFWSAAAANPAYEVAPKQQCGNYWYAASGAGLQDIFDAIANRIFTRITR
jgi:hypothetical protein